MSLHTGSSALAHNLDRFDFRSDFELAAAEAARLNVAPETIRFYRDRYGDTPITVTAKGLASQMPIYEFQIRRWILGERIYAIQQVADAAA
jgi:hypothetical protein